MIDFISNYKTVQLPDGDKVFKEGCFNCKHMIERHSVVSGRCELLRPDYKVWRDFTCENHEPIINEEEQ